MKNSLLTSLVLIIFSSCVYAEAGLNLSDPSFMSLGNRTYSFSADLLSEEDIHPDLHYEIALFKDSRLYGSKTYGEVFDLRPGESREINLEYDAPEYLQGLFEIVFSVKDSLGSQPTSYSALLNLSISDLPLTINPIDCQVFVADSSTDKLDLPIYAANSSTIYLNCPIQNSAEKEVSITAIVENFDRIGQQLPITYPVEGYTIPSASKQATNNETIYSFAVHVADNPGINGLRLHLIGPGGDRLSNSVILTYTSNPITLIRPHITLDNDYYPNGSVARLGVFIPEVNARFIPEDYSTDEFAIHISLLDDSAMVCGDYWLDLDDIDLTNYSRELDVPITMDCKDPHGVVIVTSEQGLLASSSFSVVSLNPPASGADVEDSSEQGGTDLLPILVILLLIVLLVVLYLKFKK